MANFLVELITDPVEEQLQLDMQVHVLKHPDQFRYRRTISSTAVPICYLENPPVSSTVNLAISDRTYLVPQNAARHLELRGTQLYTRTTTLTSRWKWLQITNQLGLDASGRQVPLYWRHILDQDVVDCNVSKYEAGVTSRALQGFRIDLDNKAIYTNYLNLYDPKQDSYVVYLVTSTKSDGTQIQELLNPVPVVREATWEDVDPLTGLLYPGRAVYTIDEGVSSWTYQMNLGGPYWARVTTSGLLQPLHPSGLTARELWYPRFTNGEIYAYTNESLRHYWFPEYTQQAFFPSRPYRQKHNQELHRLSGSFYAVPRTDLAIDPSVGRHISVLCFDASDVLVRAFTTDGSLDATRYQDTDVFYSAAIMGWDNQSGILQFSHQLPPEFRLTANFTYESREVELTGRNLNPIFDPLVAERSYLFYCVPDVDADGQALFWLGLDRDGLIQECSQPALQLLLDDGSFNVDTVVGWAVQGFIEAYCVNGENDFAYMILAEMTFQETSVPGNAVIVDLNRPGGRFVPDREQVMFGRNQQLLQSTVGLGEQGQAYQGARVVVVEVPYTLLVAYGGSLTEEQVLQLVQSSVPADVHVVLRWTGVITAVTGYSLTATEVVLSWDWIGQDVEYNILRRDNVNAAWVEIDTVAASLESIVADLRQPVTATVTGETSATIVYYCIQCVRDGVAFPLSNQVGVMVR